MKLFASIILTVGVVIAANVANAVDASTKIVDITTSNTVIVDLSKDFETSNSFNDSPGMDSLNKLAASQPNTRIVTVIQHGKIVGEYVRDNDVDPNQVRHVWSVTKAVMGMLFGILVDQYDTSINTTLGEFFSKETDWNLVDESNVDYMKSLSAYEILTMATGLGFDPCSASRNCTSAQGGSDLRSTLAWPVKDGERGVFNYMPFWTILSYIIKEVTDLTPRELLAAKILPAIGIKDADIGWRLEENGKSLDIEPSAIGMELTTKQMAKIGQLVLQKGLAVPSEGDDTQTISSGWIETSLSSKISVPPHFTRGLEGAMYGYQSWFMLNSMEKLEKKIGDSYTAVGAAGQFIVVHPQSGIVLVIQSDDWTDSTYDPEFDCTTCTWFLSLLNGGPDFFVSTTNSSNNSSSSSEKEAEL